jgi:tetratricopeptide (TPR) repeat protein
MKNGAREPRAADRTTRHAWVVPAVVGLATCLAFLPTLQNQFVNWDDPFNLLDNPHYRGLGWPQLRWMVTTFHMGHYIPLTWMTLGLDYLLWGMKPVGYHVTSLVLHAANAVVFYFVARRLLGLALPGPAARSQAGLTLSAGVAALLFALHPLRVESVAWATERRDVLSGFFYLLAIVSHLRSCQREGHGRRWYWTSLALFGCALLSKSMAVSLPLVLLILDVYPLRRLGGTTGWWSPRARRVYADTLPFVVLAAIASGVAMVAQLTVKAAAPLDQLGVSGRLAISAYGLGFYLWKTLAPVHLSPLYEPPAVLRPWTRPFLLSYGVIAVVTALALGLRRRLSGLGAAWMAYVVILLPVLGLFQSGPQIAADRYTYLACLGWVVLAGAGVLAWWRLSPVLVTGLVVGVLLALGVLSWNQVQVWHDSEKLWAHTLDMDPKSSFAHNNWGVALTDQGKVAEAVEHYQQALLARQGKLAEKIEHYQQVLRIQPNDAGAHINLGKALARQGKLAEAIEHYEQVLRIQPNNAEVHSNLGLALAGQGKLTEAVEHYQQALRIQPDFAEAHGNWGLALAGQGKLAEAVEHYQQALRVQPNNAGAHINLGNALAGQGKLTEAVEHFQQALRIQPNDAEAQTNLGNALADQGKFAEAIKSYQQALRIKPDFAEAHFSWGFVLARQGAFAEAVGHFAQAVRIKPDFAEAHLSWGLALAYQGKLAEAVVHYQQALRIKPDYAEAHFNYGLALADQGKLAEASEQLQQALRIQPDYAEARKILEAIERLKQAREAKD